MKKAPLKQDPSPKEDPSLRESIVATITNEVNELLDKHYEKIMEYVADAEAQSASIAFNTVINCKQKNVVTKTRLTYSQIQKDSVEDEIGDPDQPEFDETTEVAPKKRVPSKKK
jgi:hypothetical protein